MKHLLLTIALLCFIPGTQYTSAQKKNNITETDTKEIVIDSVRVNPASVKGVAIVPFRDTLFYIYGNIGSVSVEQRARSIKDNIQELAGDPFYADDSLHIVFDNENYLIVYEGKTVVGINDLQSLVLNKPGDELAKEYRTKISAAIIKKKSETDWKSVLIQIGLSSLILIVTYLLIRLINLLFLKLKNFILSKKNKTIKSIETVLDADKQIGWVTGFLRLIKFIIIAFILYACALTFFRLFPETKWLSDILLGYILTPLKKLLIATRNFIPDLFSIIVIIIVFRFLTKALKTIALKIAGRKVAIKGFYPDWAVPTYNIARVILYIFMFILIFPHLPGSKSPVFQGVSVFIGVLFSLGSTSVISNMVSGIVITYMRPFKVGDRIKMGEFLGNVIEKTPLVTRIRTPKNEIITIPNASIMTAQTINYTNSANEYGLILYTKLTMGYETPWPKIHELLIEAGTKTPSVLTDPKPFVLQLALDDFYVEYQLNVYTKDANEMINIYSNLNMNIQDVFNREGIEIMSPHYTGQRDANEPMMPPEYIRPGNFTPRAFNVNIANNQSINKDSDYKTNSNNK